MSIYDNRDEDLEGLNISHEGYFIPEDYNYEGTEFGEEYQYDVTNDEVTMTEKTRTNILKWLHRDENKTYNLSDEELIKGELDFYEAEYQCTRQTALNKIIEQASWYLESLWNPNFCSHQHLI